jgi:hypothetical protein
MMLFTHYRHFLLLPVLLLLAPQVQAKSHHHPKLSKAKREEQQLRSLAARIDRNTRDMQQDNHTEMLAEEFHVPLSVIEEQRQKGQGWGNISITLAMAQALCQKDPVHYATPADALFEIQVVRAQSKNWRQVARDAGIPLKPVLIETAYSYRHQRAAGRTERASLQ